MYHTRKDVEHVENQTGLVLGGVIDLEPGAAPVFIKPGSNHAETLQGYRPLGGRAVSTSGTSERKTHTTTDEQTAEQQPAERQPDASKAKSDAVATRTYKKGDAKPVSTEFATRAQAIAELRAWRAAQGY